jgi:hypothetical protein
MPSENPEDIKSVLEEFQGDDPDRDKEREETDLLNPLTEWEFFPKR